jgi:hypothetical protein
MIIEHHIFMNPLIASKIRLMYPIKIKLSYQLPFRLLFLSFPASNIITPSPHSRIIIARKLLSNLSNINISAPPARHHLQQAYLLFTGEGNKRQKHHLEVLYLNENNFPTFMRVYRVANFLQSSISWKFYTPVFCCVHKYLGPIYPPLVNVVGGVSVLWNAYVDTM